MSRKLIKTALVLAMTVAGNSASAAEGAAEMEISRAIDKVLINALSGQLPATQPLLIERPERQRIELGAVVDVRKADATGLPVLAVTPDSAAARLGLRVGDRLLAINDQAVTTQLDPGPVLLAAVAAGDGELTLVVRRGDEQLSLKGPADLVSIPAYTLTIQPSMTQALSGCGMVSGGARIGIKEDVRKVEIVKIDGETADTNVLGRVRLPAGPHRLTLRPLPGASGGGGPARQQVGSSTSAQGLSRPVMRTTQVPGGNRANGPAPTVDLPMVVAPNMSYQLGIRVRAPGLPLEAFISNASPLPCNGLARAQR